MNKININLAIRKKEVTSGKAVFVGAVVLAVAALILSAYNIYEYRQTSSELELYKRSVSKLEAKIARREPGLLKSLKVNAATVRGEIDFINAIIEKKAFSWSVLLNDLEAAVPKGVYIVSIEPDFAEGEVSITGVARRLDDALAMVDSMGAAARFKDVYLLKHEDKKGVKGSRDKLFFKLKASYMDGNGL